MMSFTLIIGMLFISVLSSAVTSVIMLAYILKKAGFTSIQDPKKKTK